MRSRCGSAKRCVAPHCHSQSNTVKYCCWPAGFALAESARPCRTKAGAGGRLGGPRPNGGRRVARERRCGVWVPSRGRPPRYRPYVMYGINRIKPIAHTRCACTQGYVSHIMSHIRYWCQHGHAMRHGWSMVWSWLMHGLMRSHVSPIQSRHETHKFDEWSKLLHGFSVVSRGRVRLHCIPPTVGRRHNHVMSEF